MLVAVLAFVTVSAQPPQGGPQGGQRGGDRNGRMIEMLQKQLNMSPEQAKKFGIMQAPTLVVLRGEDAEKIVGVSNIRKFIDTAKA